jgi:hypothetical protein
VCRQFDLVADRIGDRQAGLDHNLPTETLLNRLASNVSDSSINVYCFAIATMVSRE